MAKSTEAPKARVNITYRPATGNHPEGVELPLKLLMVGDYTLREDSTPLEDQSVIYVDKESFSKVMKEQKVTLDADVPDRLSGRADSRLEVKLSFDTTAAFSPESVVQQVPELKRLLDYRNALNAMIGPLENKRAFRDEIERILKDPELRERLRKELAPTPVKQS